MDTKSNRGQEGIKPPPVPYVIDNNTLVKRKSNHRENSIAVSCFFHIFFFGILSSICLNISIPEKPIAIQLSFGSSEESIDIITDGVDLSSSEDLLNSLEESLTDTNQQSMSLPPILGEPETQIDPPVQIPVAAASVETAISDIEPSDLLTEVVQTNNNAQPTNVNDQVSSIENNNLEQANQMISGILTGLTNGLSSNSLVQNRAGNASGGGIENRLASYGAKTGDLQISIAWNTIDDVDLHIMYCSNGSVREHISFASKNGPVTQGFLDIDMNANGNMSRFPVENIFYPTGKTKDGQYHIFLHLYASRTGMMEVPVILRIKNKTKIQTRKVIAQRVMQKVHVETLGSELRPFSF